MITNNKITEAYLFLVTGFLNLTHLSSTDLVSAIINFGDIATTAEIVWLDAVSLKF